MTWLATPEVDRKPPTLRLFAKLYRVTDYSLAAVLSEPGLIEEAARNITHFLRRAVDVRSAILANALDPARADQWTWIKRYDDMTASRHGDSVRILPKEPDHDPEPQGNNPERAREGGSRPGKATTVPLR